MAVDERAQTQAAGVAPSAERQVLGARYELLGLLGSGSVDELDALNDHRTAYLEHFPVLEALRALPESRARRASIAARAAAIVEAYRSFTA